MKTLYFLLIALCILAPIRFFAQVGINTETPEASSILDVFSENAGVLLPRLTEAQRDLIDSPATALIIYNIDQNCYQYNAGTSSNPIWQCFLTNTVRGARGSINYNTTTANSSGIPSGDSTNFTGTVRNTNGSLSGEDADNTNKINLPSSLLNDSNLFIGRDESNTSLIPNRIQYIGTETRFFRVTYSISYFATTNNLVMAFYVAKGNGSTPANFNDVLVDSRVYQLSSGTGDLKTVPVVASVELNPGDYIEVWASRYSGGGNQNSTQSIEVSSMNLVID